MCGLKWSKETREKLKDLHKGNSYNLGRKFTDIHKRKLSDKRKGMKFSNETKNKMQESGGTLILNTQTGIYYYGFRETGYIHNIKEKTLWNQLTGVSKNKTNLIIA